MPTFRPHKFGGTKKLHDFAASNRVTQLGNIQKESTCKYPKIIPVRDLQ